MKNSFPNLKNQNSQKGIALILAIFTIVMVSYLATELSYETNVEYLINSAAAKRVKSYYAARAGIEISLLRIKIYQQVVGQLTGQAKGMVKQDLIDMIWKMPFAWPPILPDGIDEVTKDTINTSAKDSVLDANYMTVISDEGTKIDVNSLWAPSKNLRDITRAQLLNIFQNKRRDDEKWARAHQDLRPEELVDAIANWVTPSNVSVGSGGKTSKYNGMGDYYPPNRGFRTVDEIRLVGGMTEDYFALLQDQVTVFGMKGINPNNADKEILMAIDISITREIAKEIIKRRSTAAEGGPFKDASDFWTFVTGHGARIDPAVQKTIPIITDSVYNFRITSTGSWKNTTSEITVVVYDLVKTASQSYGLFKSDFANPNQQPQSPPATNPQGGPANNNNSASKGPPRIVYWKEN